ncbi:ribonuclease J [Candidatus Kaiserbacteria bacterium]|nr:ribonuclease J [Candidatus Kaiserbacteria bacterium]USN92047.1 MAG: ribonuclease J [Candidatus Nomurabacteria bacterium]
MNSTENSNKNRNYSNKEGSNSRHRHGRYPRRVSTTSSNTTSQARSNATYRRGQPTDQTDGKPRAGVTGGRSRGYHKNRLNPGTNPARKNGRSRRNSQYRRRSNTAPVLTHRLDISDNKSPVIPEVLDEDIVRIIPVSGVEEIGRNMNIIETKDDIIVIDAGFQFVSEESNAPGINYILPNTQYLEERKDKIRALVVTHGHLDHIGGIPFIMERIGNPPIYTQYLTSLMILKRQEEFPHMDPINMNVIKEGESFTVGKTKIKTFPVTHSIPDAMGLEIETKHGDIVVTGDIKLIHEDGEVVVEERSSWEKVGENKNLALLCDSTNADRQGFSASEGLVFDTLESIIKNTKGRLIIGTFASQFDRLTNVIRVCEEMNKKVVMEGRSIKTNIEIAIQAKLMEVKPTTFINAGDIPDYPADKIVILSTGAQGEQFAALMRMATDKHKFITLTERDTIVLSSSVIPGNEIAVQKLKDNIYRKNVKVINYQGSHVHSSGHGNAGELVWVHQAVKPKFLIPVHGHHYHLKNHMWAAVENGFPRENVAVPDNGTIIDIKNGEEMKVLPMKIPTELMMVDGFTVGTKQEVVLRDRLSLAEDGMFVIIATVNNKNGKLRKSPDIISRGFVYLRENQQLLSEARVLIKKTVEKQTEHMHPLDLELVKDELADVVSGFLLQKTQKNPMVIPVLIGI